LEPTRELKLQAIRIGDVGIATIPNEVYALTGLKLKARSPLRSTVTLELANGSEGYIPTPEQHTLGGYTTWPARTAGLEVEAEPKITETSLTLLEQIAGHPRRQAVEPVGAYSRAVLASRPLAYWRLDEMDGHRAKDATGGGHDALLGDRIALYLDGPSGPGFSTGDTPNHSVHLAGGCITASVRPSERYSIELWFWNGLPLDAHPLAGDLVCWGTDRLSLGGTQGPGLLAFRAGDVSVLAPSSSRIEPKTWHHLALVRDGKKVAIFFDGATLPLIQSEAEIATDQALRRGLWLGGAYNREASFQGKLDEVAVYDRALPPVELAEHWVAARYEGR
jgi:hypothetical protein